MIPSPPNPVTYCASMLATLAPRAKRQIQRQHAPSVATEGGAFERKQARSSNARRTPSRSATRRTGATSRCRPWSVSPVRILLPRGVGGRKGGDTRARGLIHVITQCERRHVYHHGIAGAPRGRNDVPCWTHSRSERRQPPLGTGTGRAFCISVWVSSSQMIRPCSSFC